jgi:hypothetical protein
VGDGEDQALSLRRISTARSTVSRANAVFCGSCFIDGRGSLRHLPLAILARLTRASREVASVMACSGAWGGPGPVPLPFALLVHSCSVTIRRWCARKRIRCPIDVER